MSQIPMVDLKTQYRRLKREIDEAVLNCFDSTAFIKGPDVQAFEKEFADYLGANHVIGCGNGTDALQLALMALNLKPGDEIIVPAFTYVATAEVIALLRLTPVLVDVDDKTFNTGVDQIRPFLSERTRAIVPVHLFGQSADMEALMVLAREHNLAVIEDAAQAIGASFTFSNGVVKRAGAVGTVGCTSFFPTKNLGCYGDGGAIICNQDELAINLRRLANHGQSKKYHHAMIGINSRLDTVQAAVLRVKLPHLNTFIKARQKAAAAYDQALAGVDGLEIPFRDPKSTHAFHQYTLKVKDGRRDALQAHLQKCGVPSVVYYPLPLHHQKAFEQWAPKDRRLPVSERLCEEVLSLPIHTELQEANLDKITSSVLSFF